MCLSTFISTIRVFLIRNSIVQNTDGLDTFRSTNIQLLNWDVRVTVVPSLTLDVIPDVVRQITNGDDCIAIKGVRVDFPTCRDALT